MTGRAQPTQADPATYVFVHFCCQSPKRSEFFVHDWYDVMRLPQPFDAAELETWFASAIRCRVAGTVLANLAWERDNILIFWDKPFLLEQFWQDADYEGLETHVRDLGEEGVEELFGLLAQ